MSPRPPFLLLLALAFLLPLAQSPAASSATATPLPPPLPFNSDAGRGGDLVVTLHLADGSPIDLFVDTGASNTVFDTSLAPRLKRHPGEINFASWTDSGKTPLYFQPALYDGRTLLLSGSITIARDLSGLSALMGRHVSGVLGLDCLTHYCVQLDFTSHTLRFLPSPRSDADRASLGKPFQLEAISGNIYRIAIPGDLPGLPHTRSMIDSGDNSDGWLTPDHFKQWHSPTAAPSGQTRSPAGILAGYTYTGLNLRSANTDVDGLGIQFLARHLVTFDFPNRTLYLRPPGPGPLPPGAFLAAAQYLRSLRSSGLLPGWSPAEQGQFVSTRLAGSDTVTLTVRKDPSPDLYHYTVSRTRSGSLRLQRAWLSDADGRIIRHYLVPIFQ